jgi:hypothetical protein
MFIFKLIRSMHSDFLIVYHVSTQFAYDYKEILSHHQGSSVFFYAAHLSVLMRRSRKDNSGRSVTDNGSENSSDHLNDCCAP